MIEQEQAARKRLSKAFLRLTGREGLHVEYFKGLARKHGLTEEEIEESLEGD